jgi:DNA helicase II / ATP-dependent DNA helicase PcrA
MTKSIKKDFNTFLSKNLNTPQQSAVTQKDGALLVIAGAGSGKTRVITSRIAHLVINESVDPGTIVALTFTNKAAGEMRARLISTFQAHHQTPFIGTFHAYCLLLLRSNPTILQFPHFSILDADDQLDLIKKIAKKYALTKQVSPTQICHQISLYKNRLIAEHVMAQDVGLSPLLRELYLEYETEKARSHCLDFDDLIIQVLQALQNNATFKQHVQKNVRHVLVDEYQDTSHVQHQLLLGMALNPKKKMALDSLCAVGDEDQSIYSWRGATVTNMLKFQNDFAPVTTVKIEQNYRSVQPILEAANNVISNNRLRNPKNLWSTKEAKNRILAISCQSGDQEADIIASIVRARKDHVKLNNIAILYRTHFQSRPIEEALIHKAIPYRIVGGIRFYERKEIKDLLAYLRLVVNPYDKISLLRIINTPARGLGQKFEDQLVNAWSLNPLFDFTQLLTWMMQQPSLDITPSKKDALNDLLSLFADLDPQTPPSRLIDTILSRTQYMSYLTNSYEPQEAQAKIENVQEFAQAIIIFEHKQTNKKENIDEISKNILESFLHEVSLLQEKIEEENIENFVHMMTLHAAKGLEFDTVIITGLEEGLLPNTKSLNTNEELEEERRLMYVGMTRAKEHLVVSNAGSRFTFGHIVDQAPSRFLQEIPRGLLHVIDLDRFNQYQAPQFFERWFAKGEIVQEEKQPREASFRPSVLATPLSAKKVTPAHQEIAAPSPWAKHQTVFHEKFGVGIVTDVEKAPENEYYITALFKLGKKKILSRFLEKR